MDFTTSYLLSESVMAASIVLVEMLTVGSEALIVILKNSMFSTMPSWMMLIMMHLVRGEERV